MDHRTSQIAETVIGHQETENAAPAHTPTPWMLLSGWPNKIVSLSDVRKSIGGSIHEDQDREQFAVIIASAESNRYSEFFHEISPDAQRANAAFIVKAVNNHDALVKAMEAACGYLLNAKIDLETGCTKATAIKTIEGGLKRIRETLSRVTAVQ